MPDSTMGQAWSCITTIVPRLMDELVRGSPDPAGETFMLNRGDVGLVASLDKLSAAEASSTHAGGASIASHVDHLRYGLSLLNQWAAGAPAPWAAADWTASWKRSAVSESEWRGLREDLAREAQAWTDALRTPREVDEFQASWMIGNVAHLAYHLGAIRQIARGSRGPTAEDEARAKAAHESHTNPHESRAR
jgi:hypothetical protein